MNSYTCIENDLFQIFIDEAEGCNLLACFVKKDGVLLPLMPDARSEKCELDACSFIMLPYSNRIEDGTFTFAGVEHMLQRGDEHSIHGDVRQRPWSVLSCAQDRLECQFTSRGISDINWPWNFTAWVSFAVKGSCFQSQIRLRNDADTPMPAGFGWHPYFSRSLTGGDTDIHMQVAVEAVYPDTDGNCIPCGPARPVTAEENFLENRAVDKDLFLDHCFAGYDGRGSLTWPQSGVTAEFSCSDVCSHAVIYTPLEKDFIAFEPVTNANNAVNILAAGGGDAGIVVLQPGEEITASMDITVRI